MLLEIVRDTAYRIYRVVPDIDALVAIEVDGGRLEIEWREDDGQVVMTGPVATSFSGLLDETMLGAAPGRAA